jgi:CheY-like chemotaxis protein
MDQDEAQKTILVADDEPQVLELVVDLLTQHGYTVLAATDAEEALRTAEAHQGTVHLLLADIVMPGMSGTELARHLCASRPSLRVTFMSGYVGPKTKDAHLLREGAALLHKPFSAQELLATIRQALDSPACSLPA